jgi:hypothetical protein
MKDLFSQMHTHRLLTLLATLGTKNFTVGGPCQIGRHHPIAPTNQFRGGELHQNRRPTSHEDGQSRQKTCLFPK